MSQSHQLGATGPDSRSWADDLQPASPNHLAALEELEGLLLRAARFALARRRAEVPELKAGDQLARAAAASARAALLDDLTQFRGQSRFTTWAYKFAVHEAAIQLRRQAQNGHDREGVPQMTTVKQTRNGDAPASNDESLYPRPSAELARRRERLAPKTHQAFLEFSEQVFAPGALDTKTKQLIAVAVAHVTQCPYCIRAHTKAALRHGASEYDLMEAIWVAAEMRAGGAYAHSLLAMEVAADAAHHHA
jgi:AhpD family alkylhydroperoxidase